MAYSVKLSREAVLDLRNGFNWYEDKSPGLGFDFLLSIRATLHTVERNPFLFQSISAELKHIRRAVVHKFNYIIFYSLEGGDIWVFAVISSKQDPVTWKKRIE